MAQRYGGKYSPTPLPDGGQRPGFDAKRPSRAGGRVNLLFLVPFIFAIKAFTGPPAALGWNLAALALLIAAAWVTREGLLAQDAFDARKVARRPAFPRKIVGAVLTGAGLFAGGMVAAPGLAAPVLFAVIGAVLHIIAFGPDPLRDKATEGIDRFQSDRVAKAVDEGEAYLVGMSDAILRAGDRALEARVDRLAATARALFRTIEGDPRDLTAARKDIGVFLMAARDATVKFSDLYAQTRSARARADYEQLLTDLDTHLRNRTEALLTDVHIDLDVEIKVLRDRLQLERNRTAGPDLAPLPPLPPQGD